MKRVMIPLAIILAIFFTSVLIVSAATPVQRYDDATIKEMRDYYSTEYKDIYQPSGVSVIYGPEGQIISTVTGIAGSQQSYSVSGIVESKGAVVPKASVVLGSETLMSDETGAFKFTNVMPGKYDVAISAEGYAPKTVSIEVINADIDTMIDLEMAAVDVPTGDTSVPKDNPQQPAAAKTESPGFELIATLIAIIGALLYISRKK
jgi:hypothetical protein